MTKAQTTTSEASAKAAAAEANSEAFYKAKHDLFFCEQVVALAAVAMAARRSLSLIQDMGVMYPAEWKRLKANNPSFGDWDEMPTEAIHWSLSLAAQSMSEAANTMESAFMAAERAGAEA